MKCSLVFMFTSFVLNVCGGQFSGDPAPGRSPGPPNEFNSIGADYTTTTTTTSHHAHAKYTKPPLNPFTATVTNANITDGSHSANRFNEAPTNEPFISSRHREHNLKSHGNSAAIHHKPSDRLGKLLSSSKEGTHTHTSVLYMYTLNEWLQSQ